MASWERPVWQVVWVMLRPLLGAPTCSPARPHFRRVEVIAATHTVNASTQTEVANAEQGARMVCNCAHPAGTAPVVRGSLAPRASSVRMDAIAAAGLGNVQRESTALAAPSPPAAPHSVQRASSAWPAARAAAGRGYVPPDRTTQLQAQHPRQRALGRLAPQAYSARPAARAAAGRARVPPDRITQSQGSRP